MKKLYVNEGNTQRVKKFFEEKISDNIKEIEGYKADIELLNRFKESEIGKKIAVFCELNKGKKKYDMKLLKEIESMIPNCGFELTIDLDYPVEGERMYGYVDGDRFHLKPNTASLRYYLFDKFDIDDDIKEFERYVDRYDNVSYYKKRVTSLETPLVIDVNGIDKINWDNIYVSYEYENSGIYDVKKKICLFASEKDFMSQDVVNFICFCKIHYIELEINIQ